MGLREEFRSVRKTEHTVHEFLSIWGDEYCGTTPGISSVTFSIPLPEPSEDIAVAIMSKR